MKRWLIKTEPSSYSFSRLVQERRTVWDGIRNALAQIHLRAMREGDEAVVYHTGRERACVGLVRVTRDARPDPGDARFAVVEIEAVRALAQPVALAAIRADPAFVEFPLVTIGRLSVMPVGAREWKRLMQLAGE